LEKVNESQPTPIRERRRLRKRFLRMPARLLLSGTLLVLAAALLLSPVGCSSGKGQQQKVINVGMILGSAGLGDRSFNDSAYAGLVEAQKKYNIRFETVNFSNNQTNLDALRNLARNKYDLILGIAFENLNNITTVAAEFPDGRFAIIDAEASAPNVASIVYREQEGDFLMGVLAAMITKTRKVGVIGGTDIPAIRRIVSGFKQGVAYQDPGAEVFSEMAGTFSDTEVGLKLALAHYNEGADVIHNAASKTGLGIIEAARQTNKWTTGTSGDQRYLAPGNVVGNRPKRVDTAVQLLVAEVQSGTFKAGLRSLGLKEEGLSLGPFDPSIVTPQMTARLDEIKKKIIDGSVVVRGE
jgi:basic membrane protein A and related proteins